MLRAFILIILFAALSPVALCQQNVCADFQRTIKATYNFKPSQISEAEQNIKVAEMDRVWEAVKARPKELLPCLRNALEDPQADAWFRFDGSNLLVSVDPSSASKSLQVRNYTSADLDDVDLRTWVTILARRGAEGFDTSEAGMRWLAYPKARYFLPEHGAYEVKTFQGALFIFGSMDEEKATPTLLKVVNQKDHPGREHALWILMTQATPQALRALKQIDQTGFSEKGRKSLRSLLTSPKLLAPREKPKTSREEFLKAFEKIVSGDWSYFFNLVEKVPDGEKDVVATLKPEDLPLLRTVRRLVIANANPHAIEFYNSFTDILMTLVWKPELTRQDERA